MNKLRVTLRIIILVVVTTILIIPILFFYLLNGRGNSTSFYLRQIWITLSLKILGVHILVEGLQETYPPSLFVGNHRSYFDPVATLHYIKADPIAKMEVKSWTIIGQGADATGVMFVKREDPESRKEIRKQLAENIKNGRSILIYPEGTTTDQKETLPFKKGGFEMAATFGFPVIPVAIEYGDISDAWIGNDTFVPHLFRSFGKRRTTIHLFFGPTLFGTNADELIVQSRFWIDQKLQQVT
ncbi:MAG: 1-acyl-sn-glycerol-3-phosphate acyltransferase [Saprospiraceae bacterium]|nr:1-acyl-sn-glycerol-3-phosphate acyltransferase [Saprospiraceae bacterium]